MASVRRDGSWVKRQRMAKIRKMLEGAGQLKLSWLVAWMEINMGLTEKTAMKYLTPFEKLELIEIDEAADLILEKRLVEPAEPQE